MDKVSCWLPIRRLQSGLFVSNRHPTNPRVKYHQHCTKELQTPHTHVCRFACYMTCKGHTSNQQNIMRMTPCSYWLQTYHPWRLPSNARRACASSHVVKRSKFDMIKGMLSHVRVCVTWTPVSLL